MAKPITFPGDVIFEGRSVHREIELPANCVTNAKIPAGAAIDAGKVIHQFAVDRQLKAPGSALAAQTELLHIVRGATGTVVGLEAVVTAVATGDYTATIDLQKSTGGGAFATILTGTISLDSATTVREAVAAVIASAGLVEGDILQVVVAVAGASGGQATGLLVTLTLQEAP